jgi:hypothetical protein
MSGKIVPAVVTAILLAGTAAASAQAPSAEGAGAIVGGFSAYSGDYGYQGYYNYAPAYSGDYSYQGYYNYAPAGRYDSVTRGRNHNDYEPGSSATR